MSDELPLGSPALRREGVVPCQLLERMIAGGEIVLSEPVSHQQIQPASLDLRLGDYAYRIRSGFLPGTSTVQEKLSSAFMHRIPLTGDGAVLETGCVYLVPLLESLNLSERHSAVANPKSSTGRIDVFTRLVIDNGTSFDTVPAGYKGPLYAEVSPRTFSVLVRKGSRLNQIRFRRGGHGGAISLTDAEIHRSGIQPSPRLDSKGLVTISVDLQGDAIGRLVGFRAKRHAGLIDVDKVGELDPLAYWEPLQATPGRSLILDPDEFYILVSQEAVGVPPTLAAEMVPYNPLFGEFRVHYAGFFDPGFGHRDAHGEGSRAVLEVRSHEVPFMLEHGQLVGCLTFEPLLATPTQLYGSGIGSIYQRQGLALSKHFKRA